MSAPQGGTQAASRPSGSQQSLASLDLKRGRRTPANGPSNNQQSGNTRRGTKQPGNPNVYTRPKSKGDQNKNNVYRRSKDGQATKQGQSQSLSRTGSNNSKNGSLLPRRQRSENRKGNSGIYADGCQKSDTVHYGDTSLLGGVFDDPVSLGFLAQPRQVPKRPTPRFMLSQPRVLITPPFKQDDWDRQNQEKMLQMEQANVGGDYQGIYEEFQKMREVERKKMEELGLVDAENTTKDLNEAITFQGTCLDMCPVFERVRRALENNVKSLEKDPVTNKISRERAVKAFSRPAAGQPPLMPSDVRPPHVLVKTLDYITDNILQHLPDAHSFIWDRTRSIRQDFIYQNFFGPEAIDCNERIVRIHLVSLHIMAGSDVEYSQQQELEQLNKALQTLTEIYQDVRNNGGRCPNEAEFRAYHLISHFRDPELEREIQTLPDDVLQSKEVKLALRFRTLMTQNNVVERGTVNSVGALNLFVEFFRLVYSPETPYLLACLLETHFNEYRFYALKTMTRAYHTKGRAFLAESLQRMLGFDSIEKLAAFVQYYEVDTFEEDGTLLIDLFNKEKLEKKYKLNTYSEKPKLSQAYSLQIDEKARGYTSRDFVNSGHSNADLQLKRDAQPVINLVIRKPIKAALASDKADSITSFIGSNIAQDNSKTLASFSSNNTTSSPTIDQGTLKTPTFQFGQSQPPPSSAASFGGFGSFGQAQTTLNVGSLNLEDFLKAQNGGLQTSMTIPQDAKAQKTPSFSFGKASEPVKEKEAQKSVLSKHDVSETGSRSTPKEVSFGNAVSIPFDSQSQPNTDSVYTPQVIELKDEKPSLIDGLKELPDKNHFHSEKSASLQLPSSTSIPLFKPKEPMPEFQTTPPQPSIPPPRKKLIDAKSFPEAVKTVLDDLIGQVIDESLQKMLPRIIKYANRATERQTLINGLADQLFKAFVDEITYNSALKALADNLLKKRIVKKTLSMLRCNYERRRIKNDERKQKLQELQSIAFKKPSLKRVSLSTSFTTDGLMRKRMNHSPMNDSFLQMNEKQQAIRELWKPLDLDTFVEACASRVRVPEKTDLKCLLIVEDWSSPNSKWLNTKFGLQVTNNGQLYKNTAKSSTLLIDFESLPSGNSLQESLFRLSAFVVFECGLLDNNQVETFGSLRAKLERDGKILHKIVQLCNRYCLYKVQILLVLWDVQNSGISPGEVKNVMRLKDLTYNVVQDLIMCDMSSAEENVSETLQKGLQRMCERFRGKLTDRGVKKRAQLELEIQKKKVNEEQSMKARSTEEAEMALRIKEQEALKRMEETKRLNYLNKHINNSIDMSNASFRTAANSTRGLDTSVMGNRSYTLLNLNHSILNHDTTHRPKDFSVLGPYGNNVSVLEESTPFGSPRSSVSKSSLPKKVNELKELTASIRAKYKKAK